MMLVFEKIHKLLESISNLQKCDKKIKFSKIKIKNSKIIFLFLSHLIICGVFSDDSLTYISKLYLLHISIAFINFTADSIVDILQFISNDSKIQHNKKIDLNYEKFIKVKLYEVFF